MRHPWRCAPVLSGTPDVRWTTSARQELFLAGTQCPATTGTRLVASYPPATLLFAHGRMHFLSVHLVNPSDNSLGTAVITPRWLFVLAAATPSIAGDPILIDE